MEINKLIDLNKLKFDKFYNNLLQKKLDKSLLAKAIKYSSIKGGKRIRAFLVSQASKIVGLSSINSLVISSPVNLNFCIKSFTQSSNWDYSER